MKFIVKPGGSLKGKLRVPGDKSISHRCIMLGSLADGVTEVTGFLNGADALATRRAFENMGVRIEDGADQSLHIHGVGRDGLVAPKADLDLGNSGTAMRLMSGLLCGQGFASTLTGDDSLSARPMRRVADPLCMMGADIQTSASGGAPLLIRPVAQLKSMLYTLPVASAQLKSAILLAGLYADGETHVVEPVVTRDHTERMLQGFGYVVKREGEVISLTGGGRLTALSIDVPADISSAAFFMVGALIAKDSHLVLQHTGVNPTRDGVISILQQMGAKLAKSNQRSVGGEPVADIVVQSSDLTGIEIAPELVPLAIDEFPAIAIAAACARGTTVISGAQELRVKECDRIAATVANLRALGVEVVEKDDGMVITGKGKTGATAAIFSASTLDSFDDHRIAMAASLAALRSDGPITVLDVDNVATSFPNYVELAGEAGLDVALLK